VDDIEMELRDRLGTAIYADLSGVDRVWPVRYVVTGWSRDIEFPPGYFADFLLTWPLGWVYPDQVKDTVGSWLADPIGYIASLKQDMEQTVPLVWRTARMGLPSKIDLFTGPTAGLLHSIVAGIEPSIDTGRGARDEMERKARQQLASALQAVQTPSKPLGSETEEEIEALRKFKAQTFKRYLDPEKTEYDAETILALQRRLKTARRPRVDRQPPVAFLEQDELRTAGREMRKVPAFPEQSVVVKAEQQLATETLIRQLDETIAFFKKAAASKGRSK
jgi:hypothetical protein